MTDSSIWRTRGLSQLKNSLFSVEGFALCNLGECYRQIGQFKRGLDLLDAAEKVVALTGNASLRISILLSRGATYFDIGQPAVSLKYSKEALAASTAINYGLGISRSQLILGSAKEELGQWEDAELDFRQALKLSQQAGDHVTEATCLADLGAHYHKLAYQEIKSIIDPLGGIKIDIRALNPIQTKDLFDRLQHTPGKNHLLQTYEKAINFTENARALLRGGAFAGGQALLLNNLGEMCSELGRTPKADEYFAKALPILRRTGNKSGEANVLANLALLHHVSSPAGATWYLSEAVRAIESLKGNNDHLSAGALRSLADKESQLFVLYEGMLATAQRAAELQQVVALSKTDFEDGLNRQIPQTAREAAWTATYEDSITRLVKAQDMIAKLSAVKTLTRDQQAQLFAAAKAQETAADAFLACLNQIQKQGSQASAPESPAPESPASIDLRRSLSTLPRGATAIYVIPGIDSVHLLVVDEKGSKLKTVPALRLDLKAKAFGELVTQPSSNPLSAAQELYKILIKPIEHELSNSRISMWFLADYLRDLPIEALWDGKRQFAFQRYRMVRFNPGSLPVGQVTAFQARKALVFGTAKSHTVIDPVTGENLFFEALRAVDMEMQAVGEALATHPKREKDFSRKALAALKGLRLSVLHFASHFHYVKGDDRRSFLVLGDGSPWTIEDVKQLPSRALAGVNLVALVACGTETGVNALGNDTESFAGWLQRKGAHAVISTLWKLDDPSAALLMGRFYALLRVPNSKLDALHEAQITLMRGLDGLRSRSGKIPILIPATSARSSGWPQSLPKYMHPYYWAPYVLTGNWQ